MGILEAIVLGIVQGLTEFLPISSTAHLRIVSALFQWDDPGAAFTAIIQCGTLVAVVAYFRHEIWAISRAWLRESFRGEFMKSSDAKLGWLIIVGTLPIVAAGLAFQKHIKAEWRSLNVIAAAMIGLAVALTLAELLTRWRTAAAKRGRELAQVTWWDAAIVGLAQAVALIPGSSRSGTTITGGLFCGLSREAAARFSFLLSLPAVFAAAVKELWDVVKNAHVAPQTFGALEVIVCTIVSGVVGYLTIALLLRYLRTHTTYVFVAYRIAVGLFLIWAVQTGRLPAMPLATTSGH